MIGAASPVYAAPEGFTWVCQACGKRALHRVDGGISSEWDSSCFTWAVLCENASLVVHEGVVIAGKAVRK